MHLIINTYLRLSNYLLNTYDFAFKIITLTLLLMLFIITFLFIL